MLGIRERRNHLRVGLLRLWWMLRYPGLLEGVGREVLGKHVNVVLVHAIGHNPKSGFRGRWRMGVLGCYSLVLRWPGRARRTGYEGVRCRERGSGAQRRWCATAAASTEGRWCESDDLLVLILSRISFLLAPLPPCHRSHHSRFLPDRG